MGPLALPGADRATDDGVIVEVSSLVVVVVTAGTLLAIAAAILAGTLTARLLFHASRGDDLSDRPHELSP
jgi:hypothetical protein